MTWMLAAAAIAAACCASQSMMFRLKCCSLATSYIVCTRWLDSLHTAADLFVKLVETVMNLSNVIDVAKRRGTLGALVLTAVLGGTAAAAAPPAPRDLRLTVELAPDVPKPRDVGFLSSPLSNHPSFQLSLRPQRNDSVLARELTPANADEEQAVAIAVSSLPAELPLLPQMRPDTHVSHAGIGSLYWAARHSAHAWRVLLPIRPRDGSGASEDARARCAVFAQPPSGRAACS
jgi:hypothetical protein